MKQKRKSKPGAVSYRKCENYAQIHLKKQLMLGEKKTVEMINKNKHWNRNEIAWRNK